MKYIILLVIHMLVGSHILSAQEPTIERPPNIILIMADDVGRECFGCCGSKQYKTPRLDELATGGILFENCFSQPLCTPSRVKLIPGGNVPPTGKKSSPSPWTSRAKK